MTAAQTLEVRQPAYAWGQRVIALDDLLNDGSHPECAIDAVLAPRGSVGEVVKVGHAPELNEPVYLVQFGNSVVGCLEIELLPAPPGLLPEADDVA
jgi:nitrogen fixation protein NifZ